MELLERLTAKTPKFWKRVQYIGASLASIGLGILAVPATSGIALPFLIAQIANYAVIIGLTAGGVSQLAVSPEKAKELQQK